MNTLSIRKLHDLLHQQHHRVVEIFTTKTHIQFVMCFCEQYRNFFMIDLSSLPMLADEKTDEYLITQIHNTALPTIGMEVISQLYTMEKTCGDVPPHFSVILQKERMAKISVHANSYFKLLFYGSTCLFHDNNVYQIEHVRYNEQFTMYCVSIDDYYIHQSTLSRDLFKKYEELFDFMRTNIQRQSNVLAMLFRNSKLVKQTCDEMTSQLEKMQKYNHFVSSMYQRVHGRNHLSKILSRIIEVVFTIYRVQSEYLLNVENKYFTLTFHSRCVIDAMSSPTIQQSHS